MLSPSLASRLESQLDALPLVVGQAAEPALRERPPSGQWSPHENLAHLARHHEVFLWRIRRILEEDRPRLPRYRAEEDPEWPAWVACATDEVRRRLLELRRELVTMMRALSKAELDRAGIHSVFGQMTIPQWLEFFLLHEAHHLYVIMGRARGASRPEERLLPELEDMPRYLAGVAAVMSDEAACRPPAGGGFSLVEQAWHLADLEREGYGERIQRLLAEEGPVLPDFDGARIAQERDYRRRSLAEGVAAFAAARARNLARLRALEAAAWDRTGVQEGVGPVRLADVPRMMGEHDAGHRREIAALEGAPREDDLR